VKLLILMPPQKYNEAFFQLEIQQFFA